MNKKYDLAVFIGRIQPFHKGHMHSINSALKVADKVLVLVGSSNSPRTPKNPWSFIERAEMVLSEYPSEQVQCMPLFDYIYNEPRWLTEVQAAVNSKIRTMGIPLADAKVVLVGHNKDESSYYLNNFPQWAQLDSGFYPFEFDTVIDGTRIRELLFENQKPYLKAVLTEKVMQVINAFERGRAFSGVVEEYRQVRADRKQWAGSPYDPMFITTDAVVLQSGHVLLVRRKNNPGKGLWALPGGFLDVKQKVFDSCVRELREETGLKVPEIILRKALANKNVFDEPSRSSRGRTVTHAYFFHLDDGKDLPRVRGGDDAEKAQWIPLTDFEDMAPHMFEDHWHIVDYFLKTN